MLTPTIPTDLEMLNTIYKLHHADFVLYDQDKKIRPSKIMVHVNCRKVAEILGVDGDIVFGRLYYHLEEKYGYKRDDGSQVAFFALQAGGVPHCINFPLMTSVLAGLREEEDKFWISIMVAFFAFAIALASFLGLGVDL